MRNRLIHSLAAAAILSTTGAAQGAEMKWAKSFDAAMALAKSSHKLVMADFYTDW